MCCANVLVVRKCHYQDAHSIYNHFNWGVYVFRMMNPFASMMGGGKKTEEKFVYNPTKSSYHPIDDACWKLGEK